MKDKYSYYTQGVYKPIHPEKFIGRTATYRSSFELRFFRWADNNPKVLKWASEKVVIGYISPIDKKAHRYFVDNYVLIKEGNVLKKYLIEIKPYSQTIPPKESKRKKKTTIIYENCQYAVNTAKWEAASSWANKHGMTFIILTEKELNI